MREIRRLIILGCCAYAGAVSAQQPLVAHFENVLDWRVAEGSAGRAATSAEFAAFGRRFDLALEANLRVEAAIASRARAYRGALRGTPGSWARIVVTAGGPAGIIWDGATLYGVEPDPNAATPIMYRADDVLIAAGTMTCGAHAPASNAAELFAQVTAQPPEVARAVGATLNMSLGVVGDSAFAALHADPATAMLVRANNIDGIYSEQIGVQISLEQVDVFPNAPEEPFSATTDAETLLDELAIYRGSTPAQDTQGLTHLFTGRDLDGSTVGLAFLGTVCARRSSFDPQGKSFGASLTQANQGAARTMLESLIAAHEIGHNFGAPHDGEEGQCSAAPPGFLMAPAISPTAISFSQCSIDVVTANLPEMDCLTPIPVVDLAIAGRSSTATPYTDTPFDYFLEIRNRGIEPAADTAVQMTFDAGLQALEVVPQSGSCTTVSQSISCSPGEVPGSATVTIRVRLRSDEPGERVITAGVSAAEDVNATNDTWDDSLIVTLAGDVALITSPQLLMLEETAALSATLENRSDIETGPITLTGSFSEGLRIDAVELSGAACTIDAAAHALSCEIPNLAPLSSATADFTLTGIQTGSQVLTLTVGSQLPDPNTGDNSAAIALEVVDESTGQSGGDDGGGGSLGAFALLTLLGGWVRRRLVAAVQKANFS